MFQTMKEIYSDLHGCNVNGLQETLVTTMAARKSATHTHWSPLWQSMLYICEREKHNKKLHMRSEVLKTVVASINIFWDLMLRSLVGICYCSIGTCCFHLEGRILSQMWKQLCFSYPIFPNFPIPHTSHQEALPSYFHILAKNRPFKGQGKEMFLFPITSSC